MAMNRRHVRRRPLPGMMPFKVLDAMIRAGQRATPFPVERVLVIGNPAPPMTKHFVLGTAPPVVMFEEAAEITESHIALLKRRLDETTEMAMQGFITPREKVS